LETAARSAVSVVRSQVGISLRENGGTRLVRGLRAGIARFRAPYFSFAFPLRFSNRPPFADRMIFIDPFPTL
jgi:hypothetical protein